MTLDLEPIRARLAAATPGPWFRRQIGTLAPEVASHHTTTWYGSPCTEAVVTHGFHNDNDLDLDLIANAPSDLAALLAEAERLRESVQRVREMHSPAKWYDDFCDDPECDREYVEISLYELYHSDTHKPACEMCSGGDLSETNEPTPWPCPTIHALDGAE